MKPLLAVLLSAVMANAASAVSLNLDVSGGASPGDAVTIDIVADIEANALITVGLDLRLTAGGGINWTSATQTVLTTFGGNLPFSEFAPICSGPDPCVAVIQGSPVLPNSAVADPFNGVLAAVTGVAGPAGDYTIQLESYCGNFCPIVVASVSFTVVPEPTSAALLGLGLIGLGLIAVGVTVRGH